MKVIATQNFDGYRKGDEPDLPSHYAKAVVKKGLAKMAGPYENKMMGNLDNKGPLPAAGAPSSASQAAQASPQTTARPSAPGARVRRRGE
jgi:hypothetical protein